MARFSGSQNHFYHVLLGYILQFLNLNPSQPLPSQPTYCNTCQIAPALTKPFKNFRSIFLWHIFSNQCVLRSKLKCFCKWLGFVFWAVMSSQLLWWKVPITTIRWDPDRQSGQNYATSMAFLRVPLRIRSCPFAPTAHTNSRNKIMKSMQTPCHLS